MFSERIELLGIKLQSVSGVTMVNMCIFLKCQDFTFIDFFIFCMQGYDWKILLLGLSEVPRIDNILLLREVAFSTRLKKP